jgi:hypothetical protein
MDRLTPRSSALFLTAMSYEVFDASESTKTIAADDARDGLAFQDFGGERGHGGIGATSGKASESSLSLDPCQEA